MAGIHYKPIKEISPEQQTISKPYPYQFSHRGKNYECKGRLLEGVYLEPVVHDMLIGIAQHENVTVGTIISNMVQNYRK